MKRYYVYSLLSIVILLCLGMSFHFFLNEGDYLAYSTYGDLATSKIYYVGDTINLDEYKSFKEGYVFKGWTKTNNCNQIIHSDVIKFGVTYKACYDKVSNNNNNSKTVVKSALVLQGGVLKGNSANIGDTVNLNTIDVARSGYRFLGWYTASSGGSKVTGVRKLDSVIYAHWEPYRLTLHYNGNGGTWCSKSGNSYSVNSKGNVLYNNAVYGYIRDYGTVISEKYGLANYDNNTTICFKKQGYLALSGGEWNAKADGSGVSFSHSNTKLTALEVARGAGCDLTTRDCEVTLYVNWKSTTATKKTNATNVQLSVSLNANGGTVSSKNIQTVMVNKNSSINLNNYVPVRTGYVFNGWYTNSTGGSKITGSQKISKNTNYYAHWTAKTISVNFYRLTSGSDTTKVTQKFTYGKSGQKFGSTGFSKSGHTLIGWSLARGGAKNYEVLSGVANNWINNNYPSINLYAVWSNDTNVSVKYKTVNVDNFIAALDAMSKRVQEDKNWRYINSGIRRTFEAERNDNRGFSCATYVVWALQDIGVFTNTTQGFWKCYDNCGKTNEMRYIGNSKEVLEKYFTFVSFGGKKTSDLIKSGQLKRGDIVLWYNHQHTNVYAGNGKWYDAGMRDSGKSKSKGIWGYSSNGNYYFKSLGPISWSGYDKVWAVYRLKGSNVVTSKTTSKTTSNVSKNVSCYQAKARSTSSRTILKTITKSNVAKTISVSNPSCKGGACTSLQGMAVFGDKIAVLKVKGNVDSSVLVYSASSYKLLKTYHVNNSSLYHANGVTTGHDGMIHVVSMNKKNNYAFSIGGNNNINFVKSGSSWNADVLGVSGISGGPDYFSGIAYDNATKLYYFSVGSRIFKYDISSKKVLGVTSRFVNTAQDIGAYNGIVLSVQTFDKNSHYIDLYRASDMAYVGSYHVTIPVKYDIESVDFYNGKMILNANDSTDKIHILKSGVVDFSNDCIN